MSVQRMIKLVRKYNTQPSSVVLSIVQNQLHDELCSFHLGMLQGDLDGSLTGRTARLTIIEAFDVSTGNDLTTSTVLGVSNLDVVVIEQQDVGSIDGDTLCLVDVFHDGRSRDVTVLIGVDGAGLVR